MKKPTKDTMKASLRRKLSFLFSRKITVIILLLIQAGFVVLAFLSLYEHFVYIYLTLTALAIALVGYIASSNENAGYKIAWLVPFVVFPGFMALVYIFVKTQTSKRSFKKVVQKKVVQTEKHLIQNEEIFNGILNNEDKEFARLSHYIASFGKFPTYRNTTAQYFKNGEEQFKVLLEELRKAKHFIFIEYFIVERGVMWEQIFKILLQKVDEGVDVRFMYDGVGSQTILPGKYDETLRYYGIKCKVFNPFVPFMTTVQNNRDHRKIVVIDGHTAFTGGTNLADEYINAKVKYGYWKDSAVMLKGDAVWSFTIMFFQMWELDEKTSARYIDYAPHKYHYESFESDGYVIPYGESPLDSETVGRMIYLDIINKAKDYVYFTAPYLILDDEIITALGYAAKSGVDVRIVVPGIPDKWYIQKISNCYYKELLDQGVKFYRFEPGFVHTKDCVSDDKIATVGTVNLDYRSLYLHFEDGVVFYKNKVVADVKSDITNMIEKHCTEITIRDMNERNIIDKIFSGILKIFGPLL